MNTRHQLLKGMLNYLAGQGATQMRAALDDQPAPAVIEGTLASYAPDATCRLGTGTVLVMVTACEELGTLEAAEKAQLLSSHAESLENAQFYFVVPETCDGHDGYAAAAEFLTQAAVRRAQIVTVPTKDEGGR